MEVGFPPAGATDGSARYLVLGSFPSLRSQKKGQYYGHERNHFWPLLFLCAVERGMPAAERMIRLSEPNTGTTALSEIPYHKKIALAARMGVLIWDMVGRCRRTTSADDALEIVALNDIVELLQANPKIARIGLNGTRASELFIDSVAALLSHSEHVGLKRDLARAGGCAEIHIADSGRTAYRQVYRLPSTSPVPSRDYRSIDDKVSLWRAFLS